MQQYDIAVKCLTVKYPQDFIRFIFGSSGVIFVLQQELPESKRIIDYLAKVTIGDKKFILHIEFQTYYESIMPLRMLNYYARIREEHKMPVYPVVIYLSSKGAPKKIPDSFEDYAYNKNIIKFNYDVFKIWEIEPNIIIH